MKKRQSAITSAVSAALFTLLLGACGGEDPAKLLNSGKDYLSKNDGKAAVIQFKNALQKDPNLAEARFLLGKTLATNGDYQGAVVELRKALELKYSPEEAVPLLAKALLELGQAKKITDEFSGRKLDSAAATADLQTTLSTAYLSQGKPEQAQKSLAVALKEMPGYLPALIAEARNKAASKDFEGARKIIDGILAKDSKNHEALLIAGFLEAVSGNQDNALTDYRKAIEAKRDFIAAHAAAITALFQQQKIDDAAKQLEGLKSIAPKHPQTLYLDAQLNYQRKDYKAARELTQQLLKVAPENPNALQLAGAVEYQLRAYLQSESYLNKALQKVPSLPLARKLLVAIYLHEGQPAKALASLQPALESNFQDPALFSLAGETYLQNGDASKAAEYFSKASKLDPEDPAKRTALALAHLAQGNSANAFSELEQIALTDKGITADLALIAAHLRNKQLDKALAAIDVLEKKQPDNPATFNLRARTLLAKNDISGARTNFEKALAKNPEFFPAAASLAALDLAEKKPNEARKRFESILQKSPKNVQALLALAELSATNGRTPDEVATLIGRAIDANPNELAPRLALIKHFVQVKDLKKALASANNAIAILPDTPELLDALGRVLQASGDMNQALITYGKLANLQTSSPYPYLRMAEINLANKSKDDAAKNLKKALEIKPDSLEAQRGLILLAMDAKNTNEALAVARDVQSQYPKNPVGLVLEGDIHAAVKNWSDAITSYRNALKQYPATELAIKAHSAMIAANQAGDADKFANSWSKDHQKDFRFRLYLGDQEIAIKNYQKAANFYSAALTIQPENPLILNNLAWVSGELKSPKALGYAEKANKLAPNQPAFMDTLAMLLAANGQSEKAIELLRKALEISPQASAIQLNLAKVLIGAGKKQEASKELDALSKLGDKFQKQAEVERLRKQL